MDAAPVRVLIADDHPILRMGLRRLLESEPGYRVVGEATDGAAALEQTQQYLPDVLLLDLAMPRLTGLEVLHRLWEAHTPVKTIILTAAIDNAGILMALRLGARGVILKETAAQLLFKGITAVVQGKHWVGRDTVSDLVRELRAQSDNTEPAVPARKFGLTRRELDIVRSIVSGLTNKEIAANCSLREDTVKHHLSKIFDKVGASNRLELALFVMHHKLLDSDQLSAG